MTHDPQAMTDILVQLKELVSKVEAMCGDEKGKDEGTGETETPEEEQGIESYAGLTPFGSKRGE